MKISDKGINLIKRFEGLELTAYKCPADIWTIGYGHTKDVKQGQTITEQQAVEFLKQDLQVFEKAVNAQNLNLTQNQFDALVSFTYNVGAGNLQKSTLLKKAKLNVNDPSIAQEFAKWNKGGGRILPGLVKRRESESKLYFE